MAQHQGAPPEVVDEHVEIVIAAVHKVRVQEEALEQSRADLRASIQAAFANKVKVGALMKATNLSETRVYQLRDSK
jgi:cell division septum initiation protein DivIVA